MVKHHFLLLRHCVRSTSNGVNVDLPGYYSTNLGDYVGNNGQLPDWNVPTKWCTEQGLDLIAKNGAWLVDSGLVNANTHVEIISDDSQRDVDTAFTLAKGMLDELDWLVAANKNKQNSYKDSGLDLVRIKTFMFSPEDICSYVEGDTKEQMQRRFDHLRRPSLGFGQGLELLEQVVGTGRVGHLVDYLGGGETVKLDYDQEKLTGAASLLRDLSETIFYAKAGLEAESSSFAATATVHQVYQLLEFHDWYRAVMEVEETWAAMAGAVWAKIVLIVLQQGTLYDTQVNDIEEKDTMTIFAGHDTNLDTLATALGVAWNPPEYRTYPEFLTSPPGSGIHIVRDAETEEVRVSFVYPVYHKEGREEWATDYSGVLKEIPVLWSNEDQDAVAWNRQAIPSLQDLESHFLSRLSRFAGAMECYEATAHELESTIPKAQSVPSTELSSPLSPTPIEHHHITAIAAPVALVTFALVLCSCGFLFRWRRNQKDCPDDTSCANRLTLHPDCFGRSTSRSVHSSERSLSPSPASSPLDKDDAIGKGELA